jgi:hypothetical protein
MNGLSEKRHRQLKWRGRANPARKHCFEQILQAAIIKEAASRARRA